MLITTIKAKKILEKEKEINYDKVTNYLSNLKSRVQKNIDEIITYDKGYYDVSYNNSTYGDSISRIFVRKKLEYENGEIELILDKVEILKYKGIRNEQYQIQKNQENNLINTIKNNFYHMISAKESKNISWMIIKRDVKEDRKSKFETLLEIINNEEINLNNEKN